VFRSKQALPFDGIAALGIARAAAFAKLKRAMSLVALIQQSRPGKNLTRHNGIVLLEAGPPQDALASSRQQQ
jgi:hypothetical protein